MQGTLSATQDQISWVLTSYIVSAAIMTPLDRLLASASAVRLFCGSVIGFTIASMLCGAAPVARRRSSRSACCKACSARRSCRCRQA